VETLEPITGTESEQQLERRERVQNMTTVLDQKNYIEELNRHLRYTSFDDAIALLLCSHYFIQSQTNTPNLTLFLLVETKNVAE